MQSINIGGSCKTIGYHHTLLFPEQHSIKRMLDKPYDPDLIFTAGKTTQPFFKGLPTAPIGIHRRENQGGRLKQDVMEAKENICLVTPEGIFSEVERMFDFVIRSAPHNKEITFHLRLHPLIKMDTLIKKYPKYQKAGFKNLLSHQANNISRGSCKKIFI